MANRPLFMLSRRTDGCLTIMFAQRMERQQKDKGEKWIWTEVFFVVPERLLSL